MSLRDVRYTPSAFFHLLAVAPLGISRLPSFFSPLGSISPKVSACSLPAGCCCSHFRYFIGCLFFISGCWGYLAYQGFSCSHLYATLFVLKKFSWLTWQFLIPNGWRDSFWYPFICNCIAIGLECIGNAWDCLTWQVFLVTFCTTGSECWWSLGQLLILTCLQCDTHLFAVWY
jgi:hypothetical protein